MKGNFRTLLKRYCLESSVLGLKYFYLYPDRLSRCFWALNIVGLLSLACLMAVLLHQRFMQMPTRITIESQYEPAITLPYPAITICSPNQITIRAVEHFNKTLVNGVSHAMRVAELMPQLLGFYQPVIEYNEDDLKLLQMLIDKNRYTVPEVVALLPQKCEDFLRLCYFQHTVYDRCKGLFRPVLTAHGLCCAFNSVYQLKDGNRNEPRGDFKAHLVRRGPLTVLADYEPAAALDGTLIHGGSIRIMFNDWTEFPADDMTTYVMTNSESFHAIHATYTYCSEEVLQLPVDSRKCYMLWEKRLRQFHAYRNSDCDHVCAARGVEAACGCLPAHLPRRRPDRACNVTTLPCIMYVRTHMENWVGDSECQCPRDCRSRRYTVDIAQGNLAAVPYALSNFYTKYPLNKSSAVMHFYFPKAVYVKQKQETVMSLISLASNLGGVFGLCVGCSVMSVLELAFYLYSAARHRCRRGTRKTVNLG